MLKSETFIDELFVVYGVFSCKSLRYIQYKYSLLRLVNIGGAFERGLKQSAQKLPIVRF